MNHHLHPEILEPVRAPQAGDTNPEGAVIWTATEGQVVNSSWIVIGVVGFWLIIPLFILAWKLLRTACHTYTLTCQRLRERSGALAVQVDEVELYRVKDITVQQPLMYRLFGRGRVILITSDRSTPTVILNAVPAPLQVADMIRHHVEQCRVQKGVREID